MRRKEEGSVLLLTALSLPLLFAILAFGTDAVLAIEAKASQESALQTVQELRMAPAITLKAKNATDPGAVIAECVMTALRDEGYRGEIEVWFYEAGKADGLDDVRKRLYAFEVAVEDRIPTAFARMFGIESMPVASSFVSASHPYAEHAVWKPTTPRCGVFRTEAGKPASSRSFSAASLEVMPVGIREQIEGHLKQTSKDIR